MCARITAKALRKYYSMEPTSDALVG